MIDMIKIALLVYIEIRIFFGQESKNSSLEPKH